MRRTLRVAFFPPQIATRAADAAVDERDARRDDDETVIRSREDARAGRCRGGFPMRWTDARRSSSASSAFGRAAGGGGKRRGEPRCGFWGDASAVRGAVRRDDT